MKVKKRKASKPRVQFRLSLHDIASIVDHRYRLALDGKAPFPIRVGTMFRDILEEYAETLRHLGKARIFPRADDAIRFLQRRNLFLEVSEETRMAMQSARVSEEIDAEFRGREFPAESVGIPEDEIQRMVKEVEKLNSENKDKPSSPDLTETTNPIVKQDQKDIAGLPPADIKVVKEEETKDGTKKDSDDRDGSPESDEDSH